MSLYSIIHDGKEIREGFRARVLKPAIRFDSIKAAPLTTNYRIVGTAFDYLLRFFLQRINPSAQMSMWVAEEGVELIGASEYASGFEQSESYQRADRERRKADTFLNEAKRQHQAYLKTGVVTDDLLFAVLRLAYLDVAYRAGPDRVDWVGLESPDANDTADLRALISLVNEPSFRATHVCLLNPTFGAASGLVGGADADLLLDDCLIDIKTTKDPRFDVRDFFQLIGYYLLHGFGGIHCGNSKTTHEINSLAIYFSRYGYLWKVAVDEVLPPGSVPDTARWFFESVCTSKAQRLKYTRGFRGPLAEHLITQEKSEKPKSKRRSPSKKGRKSLMSNPRFHTDARKSGARR